MSKLLVILIAGFVSVSLWGCSDAPVQQKQEGKGEKLFTLTPNVSSTGSATQLCNHFIKLIEEDNVTELSTLVIYPLKRPYPVPDIQTPEAFIAYYPVLFDSVLKDMLKGFVFNVEQNSFQGRYWLPGNILIDDYYKKIKDIAYNPPAEKLLQQHLDKEIRNTIYPKLKNYDKNFIVGQTDQYIFRIDSVGDSVRFACWHAGHSIAEKPDVIVPNAEPRVYSGGSDGSYWDYVFKDGDWTYAAGFGPRYGYTFDILFKGQKKYFAVFKDGK